jgi:hypothetical protein
VHLWWHSGESPSAISDEIVPRKEIFRLGEDINTNWNSFGARKRLAEWLAPKLLVLSLTMKSAAEAGEAWRPEMANIDFTLPKLGSYAGLADAIARCAAAAPPGGNRWSVVKPPTYAATDNSDEGVATSGGGDGGTIAPRLMQLQAQAQVQCAIEAGRKWPGGRVDLNVKNSGDVPLELWHGLAKFRRQDGMLSAGATLAPGQGKRVLTHEHEVWEMRSAANGTIVAELVVDVTNGVVQDLIGR